jgi:hypothetical protein
LRKKRATGYLVVLIIGVLSAIGALGGFLEPYLPTAVQTVQHPYNTSQSAPPQIGNVIFHSEHEIQSGATLSGNVTLCCIDYYNVEQIPPLFILTSAQYTLFRGQQPPTFFPSQYVASTSYPNFTYVGSSRSEVLTFKVATYFIVITRGETKATLNLMVTSLEETHPYSIYLTMAGFAGVIASILSFVQVVRQVTKIR